MANSTELKSLLNQRFANNFFPVPSTNQFQLGTLAPPFELLNVAAGQRVKLADYLSNPAHQFVLLAFTRIFSEQHYCPFCYPHLKALNEAYDQFVRRRVEVVLITSTDLQQSRIVQQDLGFKMPLLSDPDCKVFRQYRLGQALGAPLPRSLKPMPASRGCWERSISFRQNNLISEDSLLELALKFSLGYYFAPGGSRDGE